MLFGYNVDGALSEKMSFHVVDNDGQLTRSEFFELLSLLWSMILLLLAIT